MDCDVSFVDILKNSGPEIANDKEIIKHMLDEVENATRKASSYYYQQGFITKFEKDKILLNMGDELRKDKDFILYLIDDLENHSKDRTKLPSINTYISSELLENPDFMIKAMQYKKDILDLVSSSNPIFKNKEFMEYLLEKDIKYFEKAPSDFINNPENLDYIYKAIDKGVNIKDIIDKVDFSKEGMEVLRTQIIEAFKNTEIGKDYDDKFASNKYMAMDMIYSFSDELKDENKLNMSSYLEEFKKAKESFKDISKEDFEKAPNEQSGMEF